MKKFKLEIRSVILMFSVILIVIPIISFSLRILTPTQDLFMDKVDENFTNSLKLLNSLISNTFSIAQDKIKSDLNIAYDVYFEGKSIILDMEEEHEIKAKNQVNGGEKLVESPSLKINGINQYYYYDEVDRLGELLNLKVTIFTLIPEGLLRVSTNIKEDGSRAINTYIPQDSPVYKTVIKGDTFYGRAKVIGQWFLTAYKPFYDDMGNLAGVFFVGLNEAEFVDGIKSQVSDFTIGKRGHVFIYTDRGEIVQSNGGEGDAALFNIKNREGEYIYRNLINRAIGSDSISSYEFNKIIEGDNHKFFTVSKYFKDRNWIAGINVDENEILKPLKKLNSRFYITMFIIGLSGILLSFYIARLVSLPIKRLVESIKVIADGNFVINREDNTILKEVDVLTKEINQKLIKNIRLIFNSINSLVERGNELADESDKGVSDSIGHVNSMGKLLVKIKSDMESLVADVNNTTDSVSRINALIESEKREIVD